MIDSYARTEVVAQERSPRSKTVHVHGHVLKNEDDCSLTK